MEVRAARGCLPCAEGGEKCSTKNLGAEREPKGNQFLGKTKGCGDYFPPKCVPIFPVQAQLPPFLHSMGFHEQIAVSNTLCTVQNLSHSWPLSGSSHQKRGTETLSLVVAPICSCFALAFNQSPQKRPMLLLQLPRNRGIGGLGVEAVARELKRRCTARGDSDDDADGGGGGGFWCYCLLSSSSSGGGHRPHHHIIILMVVSSSKSSGVWVLLVLLLPLLFLGRYLKVSVKKRDGRLRKRQAQETAPQPFSVLNGALFRVVIL